MKRYQIQQYRQILYVLLLAATLVYAVWSCIAGTSKAIQMQMGAYLQKQAHTAALSVLVGEEDRAFVSLRRDQNDHITAVTVNGIIESVADGISFCIESYSRTLQCFTIGSGFAWL